MLHLATHSLTRNWALGPANFSIFKTKLETQQQCFPNCKRFALPAEAIREARDQRQSMQ